MLLNLRLYKDENLVLNATKIHYTKENNKLFFEIEEMHHEIDLQAKIFRRENEEYSFSINFETESCIYELKEYKTSCNIIVDQALFELTENQLEMIYVIETEDEKNRIIIDF